MTEQRTGQVFDLGYQHYDGVREGRANARRAVFTNGVRSVLGIGRGARAKILPLLLFIGAMFPALLFVLLVSTGAPDDFIPGPAAYYQVISIILLIFSAVMAPELLVPDRRENVINLYLVRPLTATDYVAGRFLAFFVIVLALAYSGQMVLQVGLILASADPIAYLGDNWLDIPRFLLSGVAVALFITVIPMAAAAFTSRRAYAAAFVIGLFILSTGMADGLTSPNIVCTERVEPDGFTRVMDCVDTGEAVTGDAAPWFALISVRDVPLRINNLIFGTEDASASGRAAAQLNTAIPIAVYLLLTLGPGLALWWRYQRIRL
jgi:ABC-2 type transport system permease protein